MHRFWVPIIEPVLRRLAPKTIVEVGSQSGAQTARILEFCEQFDARCHVIDPMEPANFELLRDRLASRGQFHQGLSIEVLPNLRDVDVYLIDGDHNWYTVTRELEIIEEVSSGDRAPLIILHDIDWPYGRRDLYYDPANIPPEYRQPYARAGLIPGISETKPKQGLNDHLDNATHEGGEANGVLTAIEDFVNARRDRWRFQQLPGMNGLGFIIPTARDAESFARFIDQLCDFFPPHTTFLKHVEQDRINILLRATKLQRQLNKERKMMQALEQEAEITKRRLKAIEDSPSYKTWQRIRAFRKEVTRRLSGPSK